MAIFLEGIHSEERSKIKAGSKFPAKQLNDLRSECQTSLTGLFHSAAIQVGTKWGFQLCKDGHWNDIRKTLESTPNSLGFQVFIRAVLSVTIDDLICFSRFCYHSDLIPYTHCLWYLHTACDIWQCTKLSCLIVTKKQLFIAKSLRLTQHFCPLLHRTLVDTAAKHIYQTYVLDHPTGAIFHIRLDKVIS